MALQNRSTREIARYIEEYLDPGAYLTPEDDAEEVLAALAAVGFEDIEISADDMAEYLAHLPARRSGADNIHHEVIWCGLDLVGQEC